MWYHLFDISYLSLTEISIRHVIYFSSLMKWIRTKIGDWKAYKATLKVGVPWKFYLVDTVETVGVALIVALGIIRPFVFQTSVIPSGSMLPTMQIGDRLIVNKFIYRFLDPKRGDIVVFKSPFGDNRDFVKRLVGLPGETIEIKDGVIFINGEQAVFPGVTMVRDFSNRPALVIPEGSYFMMGDNRGNSNDSRFWGVLKDRAVVGKAWFTFWPLGRASVLR